MKSIIKHICNSTTDRITTWRRIVFFLIGLQSAAVASQDKEFVIIGCRSGAGLFSQMQDVRCALACYDKGLYNGIEIDFKEEGFYYDPAMGPNWFNYYFEPICHGERINVRRTIGEIPFGWAMSSSRRELNRLQKKYIKVKPFISEKIDRFYRENLEGAFVISIHYRGTDKISETALIPYDRVANEIKKVLKENADKTCKIFVATDERPFLDYMLGTFGDIVYYNKDAIRSTNNRALHSSPHYNHYKNGLDAVIDCVLLSKGNVLIHTSSNLSLWSSIFNPDIPVIYMVWHSTMYLPEDLAID